MRRASEGMMAAILVLLGGTSTLMAQPSGSAPPDPRQIVRKACDALGGLEAFRKLGILGLTVEREEISQDGSLTSDSSQIIISTPGPIPGRLELPRAKTIAADDGTGGWALNNGRPDQRPSTVHMVKRTITTQTFSLLLPFSLTWEGVDIKAVEPGVIAGKPVWRIEIEVQRSFFASPQMSRTWFVDFDQETSSLIQATCPATDLGQNVRADGMLITVPQRVKVGGVSLPSVERVVGLDEGGNQKAHTRTKTLKYKLISNAEAGVLFPNPIPVDQRPQPMKVPAGNPAARPR